MKNSSNQFKIIVSGLPGRIATQIAETVVMSKNYPLAANYALAPIGFSGHTKRKIDILGQEVTLFPIQDRKNKRIRSLIQGDEIVVDFSPEATIEDNIEFFGTLGLNCVIGTSGLNPARIYQGSVCIPDILQESIYNLLDIIEDNRYRYEDHLGVDQDDDKYQTRHEDFSLEIDRGVYTIKRIFSKEHPFMDQGLRSIRKEMVIRDRQYLALVSHSKVTLKREDMTTSLSYPIVRDITVANAFQAIDYIIKQRYEKNGDNGKERYILQKGRFCTMSFIG